MFEKLIFIVFYICFRRGMSASTMNDTILPGNFKYTHELEIMCLIKFWARIIKIIPCKGCSVETPVGSGFYYYFTVMLNKRKTILGEITGAIYFH